MSSAAEGWYVDPSTGTNLRYWNGSTWTAEIAPLPEEAPQVSLADLLAAQTATVGAEDTALPVELPVIAWTDQPADQTAGTLASPPLDPELEHTQLTRRELRARRGSDPLLDDAPKHLPSAAPPTPDPIDHLLQPEEVEIPVAPGFEHPQPETAAGPARRGRIVRLSVLLGLLAVACSVAVLTTGAL